MKRLLKISIICLLILSLCFSFFACASKLTIDGKDRNWVLVMITNGEGEVRYCSAEFKLIYPDANMIDLSCRAAGGKIVIIDNVMQMHYYGTYKASDEAEYDVTFDNTDGKVNGFATVSKVNLHDDTVEYNLAIVIDGYTLHFKSVK